MKALARALLRATPRNTTKSVLVTTFLPPKATPATRLDRNASSLAPRPSHLASYVTYVILGMLLGGSATAVFSSSRSADGQNENPIPRWSDNGQSGELRRLRYATRAEMLHAVEEIGKKIGREAVSVAEHDLEDHGYKEWSTSNTDIRPVAVVRPKSTEEVSEIAKICTSHRVPMVPYGAGSSVEGNFSSPLSGICIDMSSMDAIVAFHPDDMDVVVQPGVNWVTLNNDIKDSGLFLPLDPSPTASIGGMVSTNCSGTNATRYGSMKDYVINLTVVLADGSIIKTRQRPRKTSAGYNLTALFTGSEGTLGIISEITLKLAIIPQSVGVATASFPTVKDAADAVTKMMRKGMPLAAIELMDDAQMRVINQNGGAGGRVWEELPTLFLRFSGNHEAVHRDINLAEDLVKEFRCRSFQRADTEEQKESLWSARKQALWASLACRPEGTQMWSTDVAVPLSRMAELISISQKSAADLKLFNSVMGHVGDGNFHQLFMYNPNKEADRNAVSQLVNAQIDKAIEFEGTVSVSAWLSRPLLRFRNILTITKGEHGIGLGKKHCLTKELGTATIGVMKALKDALDPCWLLNPGKIFDD